MACLLRAEMIQSSGHCSRVILVLVHAAATRSLQRTSLFALHDIICATLVYRIIILLESRSRYVQVCKPVAIECHMCFNAAPCAANNLEYLFCRLVKRHRIFVIASHLRIGPNQRRLLRPFLSQQ